MEMETRTDPHIQYDSIIDNNESDPELSMPLTIPREPLEPEMNENEDNGSI